MIDLHERSLEKEKMDLPGHSPGEFRGCLRDIDRINRWTLAYRQNFKFVEKMYFRHRRRWAKPLKVLDVGCGSGDFLRYVERQGRLRGYEFELIGLDLNPLAIRIAEESDPKRSVRWIHGDFLTFSEKVDVVTSSLMAHHLNEGELKSLIKMMAQQSRVGWLIHDLHRHPIPYQFISRLTRWTRLHPLVQNDAPLSVARGFLRHELSAILEAAKSDRFEVNIAWHFPFKYLVTGVKDQ